MEILAVMLVIAVVASFAMPVIRSVRAETRYQRAKSAALKMAEAQRTFYRSTKGHLIVGNVQGVNIPSVVAQTTCSNPGSTGIPAQIEGQYTNESQDDIAQLFACDYLSPKDFVGLPYTFSANATPSNGVLLTVTGNSPQAGRYNNRSFVVNRDMTITGATENM